MKTIQYNKRIIKGCEWLNDNQPGWFTRIDLDKLDLGNPPSDIFGQLELTRFSRDKMVELGFTLPRWNSESLYQRTRMWRTLNNRWKLVIEALQRTI